MSKVPEITSLRVGRVWVSILAVRRLLAKSPLGPEEIDILAKAYERTLHALGLVDRNDPLTEIIAKKIIEIGQTGLRDPSQISAQAVKELGLP